MIGEKSLLKNYVSYLKNDVNYSFIMFKPDAKGNPEIFDLVNKEMKKQSIELFFVYNCILDEEQVITLWENSCCSDFVLQRIVVEYLKNVEVIFWIVKGDNIYEKTKEIKMYIRGLYAQNWLKNALHTPDNHEEFIVSIAALADFESSVRNNKKNEYEQKYIDYLDDNKEELLAVVQSFILEGENWIFNRIEFPKCKYRLIIKRDCINRITHFMAMLHEIFPHYTIEKCLLLTEAIFEMGQYHIYESDSLLDVYDKKRKCIELHYSASILPKQRAV